MTLNQMRQHHLYVTTHREFFSQLPNANLKLFDRNKTKTESNEAELRQAALHTVQKHFPAEQWIRIYTDGSSIPVSYTHLTYFVNDAFALIK